VAGICEHVNEPSGAIKLVANLGSSDLAVGNTMRHCAVRLHVTSESGSSTVHNPWNFSTS
jgi:hypothetical protein